MTEPWLLACFGVLLIFYGLYKRATDQADATEKAETDEPLDYMKGWPTYGFPSCPPLPTHGSVWFNTDDGIPRVYDETRGWITRDAFNHCAWCGSNVKRLEANDRCPNCGGSVDGRATLAS